MFFMGELTEIPFCLFKDFFFQLLPVGPDFQCKIMSQHN